MARRKTAKKPYHHGNLREELISAALEIVTESGTGALSLREAARRAGVSHTAPYRHFDSKGALIAAVAGEGFRSLYESVEHAMESAEDDPVVRLGVSGIAYVKFAANHPAHFRVMFGPDCDLEAYPDSKQIALAAFQQLLDGVIACQEAGAIRTGDPMKLARVAWAQVHGLSSLIVDGRIEVGDDDEIERLSIFASQVLFHGMS